MSLRTILLAIILIVSGCSTVPEKAANADKNKLGVLIVAGEGYNPNYPDATDQKAKAIWLETSKKLAEYLQTEIEKEQHTAVDQFVNTNPVLENGPFVAQLLANKKRDGLIQVRIRHIKNSTENSIYLVLSYSPLQYGKNDQGGETVMIGKGIEEKYTLLGTNFEGSKTPLNYFTHNFISKLSKAGYIGE